MFVLDAACKYITSWTAPLKELEVFGFALLNKTPTWKELEATLLKLTQINAFNDDDVASKLHNQFSHVKIFCSKQIIRTWNEMKIPVEDRWNQIFKHFDMENIDFKEMAQVIEFILCLPGTNSSVERVFSEMNKTWTEDKSALSVETLKAALMVKTNLK